MPDLAHWVSRARRRAAALIAPGDGDAAASAFYPQQPTCQIPDLWYLYATFLGERQQGVFVEVGANDGVTVSNSWGLAERGWTGVMAEPVPELAAACRRSHAGHPRVAVVETAVGAPGCQSVVMMVAGLLSTAKPEAREEYAGVPWAAGHLTSAEVTVACVTLDALLEAQAVQPGFDVLIVDVEGFEVEVFEGFDLPRWAPRMIIVELVDLHPSLVRAASEHAHLGARIADAGYRVAYKDGMNTVLVRQDVWDGAYA